MDLYFGILVLISDLELIDSRRDYRFFVVSWLWLYRGLMNNDNSGVLDYSSGIRL